MKFYTPTEARDLMVGFLRVFPGLGRTLITGDGLEEFNAAVEGAEVISRLPPTQLICNVLEDCLGIMVNCLLDARLLYTKPEDKVQLILDVVEIPGVALAIAGGNWPPADTTSQQ